jgi:hypothetical protein
MNKVELCKKFVTDPGDDIYQLVETLVDMREEPCECVYPGAKPCTRTVESPNPFGLCPAHLKTKRGIELSHLWNDTLEELNIEESDEEDEDDEEEDEIQEEEDEPEEEEEVVVEPVVKARAPQPVKTARAPTRPAPPARAPPRAPQVPAAKKPAPKKPRATRKEASEESSLAEGSARAEYVEPTSEEEVRPDSRLKFHRSKHQNLVNSDGFVLRPSDKTVLGVEGSRGGIIPLTASQRAVCDELGLNYIA